MSLCNFSGNNIRKYTSAKHLRTSNHFLNLTKALDGIPPADPEGRMSVGPSGMTVSPLSAWSMFGALFEYTTNEFDGT